MIPLWIIFISIIIVLLTIRSILFKYSTVKILADKIPGPYPYPFIGSALLFVCNTDEILNILQSLKSEYGNIYRVWLARELNVILSNPNDLQLILKTTRNNKKIKSYSFVKPLLGDGLIISEGTIWQEHRKMLTPPFHFKILEHSVQVMHKSVQILANILDGKVGKPEFDVHDYITKCSLSIICGSSMGVEFDLQQSTDTSYWAHLIEAIIGATEIITSRLYKIWLQPEFLFRLLGYQKRFTACVDHINNITKEIVEKKREILKMEKDQKGDDGGTKCGAFLDLLFQENLNDREILEEVKTFMFAGHDTTNSAINFLLYALSHHPDVQDKIYEELVEASLYVDDSCPTIQQLNNQRYLESVIKESLRLYPPVPIVGRELGEDVITTDGHLIPAGTNIGVFIFGMHRNEEYYENCEKFDPERFLNMDTNDRNPFSYIPFSAGPRNCIGQKYAILEIKVTIGMLIKKFKLLPSDKKVELEYRITLRSKNGFHIKLAHR